MRKNFLGSLAAMIAINFGLSGSVLALPLGAKMPQTDVQMKNIDGKNMTLADIQGKKGTLVVFSCNACPWVIAWEDRISALGNEYRAKGVGVVAINSNDPTSNSEDGFDVMKTRAKEKGFKFPYVVDSTSGVAKAFEATRTPEAFLFNEKGELVYHGTIDDNAKKPEKVKNPYLQNALKALVTGKDIPQKETKALGCGIKFRPSA